MMDFTIEVLKNFLLTLKENDYTFVKFTEYWKNREKFDNNLRTVLLRHDVDRFPNSAQKIAKLESQMGVKGTFFFRDKPWSFAPKVIESIHKMGHEIGFHYECLSDAHGDFEKAKELFTNGLQRLRNIAPVVSAAMHSRPLSKWDSRLFWKYYKLEEFDLLGETYLSVDHQKYVYLADSGRKWSSDRAVVWDFVQGETVPEVEHTSKLFKIMKNCGFKKVHLLIHPNRWQETYLGWGIQYSSDLVINILKTLINKVMRKNESKTY